MSATDAPRFDADQGEQPDSGDPPIGGDLPSPRRGACPTPRSVLQEATPYVPGQVPDEEPRHLAPTGRGRARPTRLIRGRGPAATTAGPSRSPSRHPIGDGSSAHPALYGELLPSWYDDWVLLERERLRQLRMHAWEALSEKLVRAGR